MRKSIRAMVPSALLLCLLGGCSNTEKQGTDPTKQVERKGPIQAVATVGMITDIVKRVGGSHVEVVGLMGAGVDPHLYKANVDDIRKLNDAEIIFYNGLNLEGKMGDLFVRMAGKKPTVPVAEHIPEKDLREPPEMRGHYDPHIWFDVSLWIKAVERVREALSEQRPALKETFVKNAQALLQELERLHAWCKEELAKIPKERRVLITSHDAFGYFGRAYDMEVRAIQGISTESEAGMREIEGLVSFIIERRVKAVFVESSVPKKNIEALVEGCKARRHEVVIGGELFSDAMGAEGTPDGTYPGMIKHNVELIVQACQ